jgi:tight adherence protein C
LKSAVRSRQRLVVKALPDALDMVTTCVEAGLGLDAALGRVADQMKGPLAAELSQTLREIAMGRLRREALSELGERTGVQELISFVNAVIQAEQLGVSVAQVLKVQSDQMRMRRRQRAEQLAHEAPVKMVFPLVLCIFPAFMLVILGPAVISISQQIAK